MPTSGCQWQFVGEATAAWLSVKATLAEVKLESELQNQEQTLKNELGDLSLDGEDVEDLYDLFIEFGITSAQPSLQTETAPDSEKFSVGTAQAVFMRKCLVRRANQKVGVVYVCGQLIFTDFLNRRTKPACLVLLRSLICL